MLLDNIKKIQLVIVGKGDFISNSKIFPSKIFRKQDSGFAYTGWQILNPKIIDEINVNKFSLNICYDKAIENNLLWGINNSGKWLHIGTKKAALSEAIEWFKIN